MSRSRNRRKGGAAVEAALTLPLILLLITATLELSTAIYLKESLTIAAYEGARVAVSRKGDNTRVIERVEEVFVQRGISTSGLPVGELVTITPAADEAATMEPITISVRAPTLGNVVVPFRFLQFFTGDEVTASFVMRKEYRIESL